MFEYIPTFVPNKVMIIGGGGTGSRLVPLLAQFLKTCAWIQNPEITVIDDDVVEDKNLLRQNFIATDVGKHKAAVLAQRYSKAFNIPIVPVLKRVTPLSRRHSGPEEEEMQELFSRYSNNAIIVMCVDSPEARRHIMGRVAFHGYNNGGNVLLMDSGNENDFGQINVSNGRLADSRYSADTLKTWGNKMPGNATLPIIPMDLAYFEDMRAETTLSCADLDQTMAINTMMAVTMFGVIQNFVYAKPIAFHRLNVTLGHGVTPEYMNPMFLDRVSAATKIVGQPFTTRETTTYIPSTRIDHVIEEFEAATARPMRQALKKAEKDAKAHEVKAMEIRDREVSEAAVKAAMALYGWTIPGKEEPQATSPKGLKKGEREQLVEDLKQDFLTLAQKEALISPNSPQKSLQAYFEPYSPKSTGSVEASSSTRATTSSRRSSPILDLTPRDQEIIDSVMSALNADDLE